MDLNKIIPKTGEWKVSKNTLYKKNIAWIPILQFDDDLIKIILDFKSSKDILKLTNHLSHLNCDFIFISPLLISPLVKSYSQIEIDAINVKNYLLNYSRSQFYDGFLKIGYDFIGNLIDYCKLYNCEDLIKDIYLDINKIVQKKTLDYYSNKSYYEVREDIRTTFNSLYRDIQLQKILK